MAVHSFRRSFPVHSIPCATPCIAAAVGIALVASSAAGQIGTAFVDARSNIFGYGVSTPQPGGGGGGVLAVTITLDPGSGRALFFTNTGSAGFSAGPGTNGPDGGAFANATNLNPVGPISGFAAPLTGHLVGLFLEAGDPAGLAAPARLSYQSAASLMAPSFSPGIRQIFFIGDGLTGTGSGATQRFAIPDTATRLVLGIADGPSFAGPAGFYDDNTGGYTVNYTTVPAPSAAALFGLVGALVAARRRRAMA